MKVYHQLYGEGIQISVSGNMTTVRFDSCGEIKVLSSELSQVIHS